MEELKKAVWNWRMAAAVLTAFLVLVHPLALDNVWSYMKTGDVLYWITFPMATSGFTPFACVFPILPYGMRFVEEYNTGYIKAAISRSGKRSYIRRKIAGTAVSGGCMMAAAFFLIFFVCLVGGSEPTPESLSEFYEITVWRPYVFIWGGKLVLLMKLALAFLHGAVWALAALLVSSLYANRYAVLILPFVVYQTLWHMLQNTPVNPVYLLRADWGGYQVWYQPFLIQLAIVVLLALLCALSLRRKVYEL